MKTVRTVDEIQSAFIENKEAKYHGYHRKIITKNNTYYVVYDSHSWCPPQGTVVISKRFKVGTDAVYIMQRYFEQRVSTVEDIHAYNIVRELSNRSTGNNIVKAVYLNINKLGDSIAKIVENTMNECLNDCARVTVQKYRDYVLDASNNIKALYTYVPGLKDEVDQLTRHNFEILVDKAITIYKKRMK